MSRRYVDPHGVVHILDRAVVGTVVVWCERHADYHVFELTEVAGAPTCLRCIGAKARWAALLGAT